MKNRLPSSQLDLPINSTTKSRNPLIPFVNASKSLLSLSKRRLSMSIIGSALPATKLKSQSLQEILLSSARSYFTNEDEVNASNDCDYMYASNTNPNPKNESQSNSNSPDISQQNNNIDIYSNIATTDFPNSQSPLKRHCPLRRKTLYNKLKNSGFRKRFRRSSTAQYESLDNQTGHAPTRNNTQKFKGKIPAKGFFGFVPCSNVKVFLAVVAFLTTVLYNSNSYSLGLGSTIKKVTNMAITMTTVRNYSAAKADEGFNLLPTVNLVPHKCNYPKLNPNSSEVLALFSKTKQNSGPQDDNFCAQESYKQNVTYKADYNSLIKISDLYINAEKNPDQNYKEPTCCYRVFGRRNDWENWMNEKCIKIHLHQNETIRLTEEFISLECKLPVFQKDYKDMFAFVPEKPDVESRVNKINSQITSDGTKREDKISVIIFGMDSVSHLHFKRQMPKSLSYLRNVLHAIPLDGYTKVAENTLPNVIPLLSGMTLEEFKADCITPQEREGGETHLDDCPLIWKWFASQGYRTSYGEDQNNIGIFQMYWSHAFNQQPTDYYLKTLTRQMEGGLPESPSAQCLGSRLSFKVLLDHMLNLADAFKEPDRLYFQFSWSTRLSHDKMENLHWGDEDLHKSLKSLHDNHHLNKSILILLSDHGSRLAKIRELYQGQVEDRMPLAYIVLPPWFPSKYPEATKNLRENAQRLTSAFDIHKTLLDLTHLNNLNDGNIKWKDGKLSKKQNENQTPGSNQYQSFEFENSKKNRNRRVKRQSKSLFEKLDENRSCLEAGIPLHWCLCQNIEPIDVGARIVQEAAQFAVNEMNAYVRSKQSRENNIYNCEILKLNQITRAVKWSGEKMIVNTYKSPPKSTSTNYNDSTNNNGYDVNVSSGRTERIRISRNTAKTKNTDNNQSKSHQNKYRLADVRILQIAFTTEPGEGVFEATIVQLPPGQGQTNHADWILTERIARTNSYGEQSYCVDDYELKEYCYCNMEMDYFNI